MTVGVGGRRGLYCIKMGQGCTRPHIPQPGILMLRGPWLVAQTRLLGSGRARPLEGQPSQVTQEGSGGAGTCGRCE